ncbi:hypothetical protein BDP81DRAFT_430490 [Colletotrichum phormii]|uniref:Flavin reductase like domain-containing protein n=1 Tax=Colletotrichum phormii TaxID=359342 RepID=A0AAI9ZPQ4_9PEZI|nr:uncharacterized protein BDP81DRAFT_430490 [Colletotrichum phormii]KAK1635884.1 hypothetical protein BDP81DRAFT_430490 [Colletotrichum phormii]
MRCSSFGRLIPRRPHPAPALLPSQKFSVRMSSNKSEDSKGDIAERLGNFEEIQTKRPDFDHSNARIEVTKSPDPTWSYGQGVRTRVSKSATHKEIDPYASDRSMINNYRLLVSGIAPRPVGFRSTLSKDGKKNLAPFSYFQVIDHDPPMFIVGFSSRPGAVKDSYRNLKETGECVINTVSEDMIEAVNATSIDAPRGVSEWDISGLHEGETTTVKPLRVLESVFSIEAKVVDIKEFSDHAKDGKSVAGMVLLKATRFWVIEDAADSDYSHIELEKLRPIGQLGGKAYGRITSTFEVPRRRWQDEQKSDFLQKLDKSTSKYKFLLQKDAYD